MTMRNNDTFFVKWKVNYPNLLKVLCVVDLWDLDAAALVQIVEILGSC